MGVIYHAHARFLDRKQGKVTVPAPIDATTPTCPGGMTTLPPRRIELALAGFSAILYPPVSKTQSGHWPTGDGYGVFDQYDIGWKNQVGARRRGLAIANVCSARSRLRTPAVLRCTWTW
jgi:hypothetical protein